VNSSKVVSSITLPSDGNVKILAIDETYKGGGYLPALAIVNLKPGNQTNPINTPNSGSHSSLVNPVLIPTLTTLILGTVSDADSAPLPGRTTDRPNNRILSIKLPVSSTGGLPSIRNVTVDYAVESSPPRDRRYARRLRLLHHESSARF